MTVKVAINEIDVCECCGEMTETSRNKKTGELLCWECLSAIEENEKLVKQNKSKKENEE